jgi:hypothetical protein
MSLDQTVTYVSGPYRGALVGVSLRIVNSRAAAVMCAIGGRVTMVLEDLWRPTTGGGLVAQWLLGVVGVLAVIPGFVLLGRTLLNRPRTKA